jgi:hypothetical protein
MRSGDATEEGGGFEPNMELKGNKQLQQNNPSSWSCKKYMTKKFIQDRLISICGGRAGTTCKIIYITSAQNAQL